MPRLSSLLAVTLSGIFLHAWAVSIGDVDDETKSGELAIQIASDIHLEFYDSFDDDMFDDFIKPAAPILALLGDIGLVYDSEMEKYQRFLASACKRFERVLLLAGNHEYYTRTNDNIMSISDIMLTMRGFYSNYSCVTFLENEALTINGVRLVIASLWTHVPPEKVDNIEGGMNDYYRSYISNPNETKRALRVEDTNRMHNESLEFISKEARSHNNVLVLTHHAPSFDIPGYGQEPSYWLRTASATDLNSFIAEHQSIGTWAFGHTHKSCDVMIHGTRVVSNQKGYPKPSETENDTGYVRDFVLRIDTLEQQQQPKSNASQTRPPWLGRLAAAIFGLFAIIAVIGQLA